MLRMRKLLAAGFTVALLGTGAVVVAAPVGAATTFTVTNTNDDGSATSLRDILENQIADGDTVELVAGATYTLDDDECDYIYVSADVTINGNGATIEQTCQGYRVLDLNALVSINGVTITGGTMDGDGGGIYVDDEDGSLTLRNSTVTGNVAFGDGGGIFGGGPVTIIDSTISDNSTGQDGGALANRDDLWVIRSSVTGNCSQDDGGALDGDGDAWFVNSTVTGNTSDDQGAIAMDDGALTLVYATIAANTLEDGVDCGVSTDEAAAEVEPADTEEPSNVQVGSGGMRAFGTVISNPIDVNQGSPGAYNCVNNENTVVSSGYNYSDDDTCELTAATDKQNAADPLLGPLAANGGPTRTHLPQAGSPLIDAIPLASCGGGNALADATITTDQRSLVRPDVVNQKCDIGAVEVQTQAPPAPPAIQPTFTG